MFNMFEFDKYRLKISTHIDVPYKMNPNNFGDLTVYQAGILNSFNISTPSSTFPSASTKLSTLLQQKLDFPTFPTPSVKYPVIFVAECSFGAKCSPDCKPGLLLSAGCSAHDTYIKHNSCHKCTFFFFRLAL